PSIFQLQMVTFGFQEDLVSIVLILKVKQKVGHESTCAIDFNNFYFPFISDEVDFLIFFFKFLYIIINEIDERALQSVYVIFIIYIPMIIPLVSFLQNFTHIRYFGIDSVQFNIIIIDQFRHRYTFENWGATFFHIVCFYLFLYIIEVFLYHFKFT